MRTPGATARNRAVRASVRTPAQLGPRPAAGRADALHGEAQSEASAARWTEPAPPPVLDRLGDRERLHVGRSGQSSLQQVEDAPRRRRVRKQRDRRKRVSRREAGPGRASRRIDGQILRVLAWRIAERVDDYCAPAAVTDPRRAVLVHDHLRRVRVDRPDVTGRLEAEGVVARQHAHASIVQSSDVARWMRNSLGCGPPAQTNIQ